MLAILSGSILLFVISLKDEMLSDASDEGDNGSSASPSGRFESPAKHYAASKVEK